MFPSVKQKVDEEVSVEKEPLTMARQVCGRWWYMNRLGPLYRFTANPRAFALYREELRRHLAAELDIEDTATIQISFSTLSTAVGEDGAGGSDEPNESFVVDDDEDDDDDADGGGFKNPFRGESGGGRGRYKRPRGSRALNDAVAISVFAPLFHRSDAQMYSVYLLLCAPQQQTMPREKRFVTLPLMLRRGSAKLATMVVNWINARFDAWTGTLAMPSYRLQEIMASWAGSVGAAADRNGKARPLEVSFAAPEAVAAAGLEFVDISLPWSEFSLLRRDVAVGAGDNAAADQVDPEALMGILCEFGETNFGVDLRHFQVDKISSPVGTLTRAGKIKINDAKHIQAILAALRPLLTNAILDREVDATSTT